MTDNDIKQLVPRFMEGETSLDEERRLAEYFRSHPAEPGMEDVAAMFALFDTGMPVEGVTDVQPKAQPARRTALHPAWWLAVAAVAVLLVAFTFSVQFQAPTCEPQLQPVVCHAPQQPVTEQPAPQVVHEQPVAQAKVVAKPKSQPAPVPELAPDSVVEAVLLQQEMEVQQAYDQMLDDAYTEAALLAQAKALDAMADYVANLEYVETIPVW